MRRYVVNYARKFPDHRIAGDFKVYQEIKSASIFQNLKMYKAGINDNLVKYHHVFLALGSIFAYGIVSYYLTSNVDTIDYLSKRITSKSSMKWGLLNYKPGIGRFDNVLNRFENEEGGIKDWPIQQ